MEKRAQRIPSWPGVIHSNKGRIHLRRPTCGVFKFRLRRGGGPYIPISRQFWSLYAPERIGIDPLLAERGTTCGTYTTLERHWDAPGFLLAFEARFSVLREDPSDRGQRWKYVHLRGNT